VVLGVRGCRPDEAGKTRTKWKELEIMPKHVLSQTDLIELADILRKVCIKADGDVAVFTAGWSDARIVAESGGRFVLTNVQGLRRKLIGDIKTLSSKEGCAALPHQASEILRRIGALESWAAARSVQPFKLA